MESGRRRLRQRVRDRSLKNLAPKLDASDLVQNSLAEAVARLDTFRGRSIGEFHAWLAGILDRQVPRAWRFWGEKRRDPKREEELDPAWSSRAELAESTTSILERLCRKEERERLELAASWCREEDWAVIAMHLFEGRSHEEIAAELGVAAATTRQRYCRAVRQVGQAMQLLALMTRRGWSGLEQDVIGVHRFQGADPQQIASRFQLPEELVARWIAEAQPLFLAIAKDRP
jgi:RNA polymerase sigma-70 factor (ECF subfamily)